MARRRVIRMTVHMPVCVELTVETYDGPELEADADWQIITAREAAKPYQPNRSMADVIRAMSIGDRAKLGKLAAQAPEANPAAVPKENTRRTGLKK